MSIFISLIFVIATMTLFTWLYRRMNTVGIDTTKDTESNNHPNYASDRRSIFTFMGSHMIYVINTLTNQGKKKTSNVTQF